MNDPKEIAEEAWSEWNTGLYNSELGFKQLIDHAIATAIQAERDKAGNVIGQYVAELERVKAACSHQWAPSEDSFECKLCGESDYGADRKVRLENITLKDELEIVKKQRDESAAKEASATTLRASQQKMIETVWKQHEQQFAAMKAERDEAVEKEQGRWQEAIYQLLLKHAPDNKIDGAGCDSGDPLDFTLTEIGQAINHIVDEHDEAVKALEPFAAIARMFSSELPDTDELHIHTLFGHQSTYATLGHCRAARAVVEKVKQ